MRVIGRILFWMGVFTSLSTVQAQQYSYHNTPLLAVIDDIEQQSEYRFLYREALISDISISMDASQSSVFSQLSGILANNNLGLKVDDARFQALIYKTGKTVSETNIRITGYVLDAETGERLPAATISWRVDGNLAGTSSSPQGTFEITETINTKKLTLLTSFVGYTPKPIVIDIEDLQSLQDVAIRLEPAPYNGKEIVVNGVNFYTPNDTVLSGLIKVGTFSPMGESNAVRSLQLLPSVSVNAAINDGINIRGSAVDGFQVLLDGQPIYNQSHLFGLLDSMNPDVLKSSGFYYDVTPAQYQAPLGGTLALITRTGSLNEVHASSGISNTALNSTFEGPILKGKASWLISGRLSFMDDINWFNNQELIEFGLDVNRPTSILKGPLLSNRLVRGVKLNDIAVESTKASFYDTHAKLYYETKNGSQFSISGYLGADEATQFYSRNETTSTNFYLTSNQWDNASISSSFSTKLDEYLSITRIGYSMYNSLYQKDDFAYTLSRNTLLTADDSVLIGGLKIENSIDQFDVYQSFSKAIDNGRIEFGLNYSDFDVRYKELNEIRTSFFSRRTSQLVDIFQQLDITPIEALTLNIGNRLHYFSNGQYLRWSPRVKATVLPQNPVSFSAGYARNYQFINRLQLYNVNTNDFWVMANEDQPPAYVDSYTSGVYVNLHQAVYIQAELYYKDFSNLRLHELNLGGLSTSYLNRDASFLYQSEGISKGLEILMKNRLQPLTLTTAYTLSSTELRNDFLNNGAYYFADWDRTHQLSMVSDVQINKGFNVYLSWTYGSGAPFRYNLTDVDDSSPRMPDYSRLDATLSYEANIDTKRVKASFTVYNLTNRNNPWYTERQPISVELRNQVVRSQALTNVFDLGIQPSFNLSIYF